MFRKRLREKYTDEQLKQIYSVPHDHTHWRDHLQRVEATISAATWVLPRRDGKHRIADLSTGDACIPRAIAERYGGTTFLGDFAPGYGLAGPLEETLEYISDVDLYVCSETLEHLDDPDKVLRQIRAKSKALLLSTPIGEDNDHNPQHYWGWDTEAVKEMLCNAGWTPETLTTLSFTNPRFFYSYQIWTAT